MHPARDTQNFIIRFGQEGSNLSSILQPWYKYITYEYDNAERMTVIYTLTRDQFLYWFYNGPWQIPINLCKCTEASSHLSLMNGTRWGWIVGAFATAKQFSYGICNLRFEPFIMVENSTDHWIWVLILSWNNECARNWAVVSSTRFLMSFISRGYGALHA